MKVKPGYHGPLVIEAELPKGTYRIAQISRRKGCCYHTTAHSGQLKLWHSHAMSEDTGDNESKEE